RRPERSVSRGLSALGHVARRRRAGLVQELLEPRGLLLQLALRRGGEWLERRRADATLLHLPRAGDEAVDEERLRDVAVHTDHPLPVSLGQEAAAVGMREQNVVPLRQ